MSGDKYTEDYYERGLEKGISCYQNYRWLPEKTIPAVMSYIDYLRIPRGASVLDFGCAKGFYVKAFRMLYRNAWGCDISKYAIEQADESVQDYVCFNSNDNLIPFKGVFDYIIAKDVLEHLEYGVLHDFLNLSLSKTSTLFSVVPLCDEEGQYIISTDEMDVTHVIRYTEDQWREVFTWCGWRVGSFSYYVPGLKEHQSHTGGVGFYTLLSDDGGK